MFGFSISHTSDFLKERQQARYTRVLNQRVNSLTTNFWRDQLVLILFIAPIVVNLSNHINLCCFLMHITRGDLEVRVNYLFFTVLYFYSNSPETAL